MSSYAGGGFFLRLQPSTTRSHVFAVWLIGLAILSVLLTAGLLILYASARLRRTKPKDESFTHRTGSDSPALLSSLRLALSRAAGGTAAQLGRLTHATRSSLLSTAHALEAASAVLSSDLESDSMRAAAVSSGQFSRLLSTWQGHGKGGGRDGDSSLPAPATSDTPTPPDAALPPAPLILVVNPKSGGGLGARVIDLASQLQALHPTPAPSSAVSAPVAVFQLTVQGLADALALLEHLHTSPLAARGHGGPRLVCAGGDGTVSAIIRYLRDRAQERGLGVGAGTQQQEEEEGLFDPSRVPVAVLPLGTGNDAARSLGLGGSAPDLASPTALGRWLYGAATLPTAPIDVWDCAFGVHPLGHISVLRGGVETVLPESEVRGTSILYTSIGPDAELVWAVELRRTTHPVLNKLLYALCGGVLHGRNMCSWRYSSVLRTSLATLSVVTPEGEEGEGAHGQEVARPVELRGGAQSLLILSAPSYASGAYLWPTAWPGPPPTTTAAGESGAGESSGRGCVPSMCDGRLEVLSCASLAQVGSAVAGKTGLLGGLHRLGQVQGLQLTFHPPPQHQDGTTGSSSSSSGSGTARWSAQSTDRAAAEGGAGQGRGSPAIVHVLSAALATCLSSCSGGKGKGSGSGSGGSASPPPPPTTTGQAGPGQQHGRASGSSAGGLTLISGVRSKISSQLRSTAKRIGRSIKTSLLRRRPRPVLLADPEQAESASASQQLQQHGGDSNSEGEDDEAEASAAAPAYAAHVGQVVVEGRRLSFTALTLAGEEQGRGGQGDRAGGGAVPGTPGPAFEPGHGRVFAPTPGHTKRRANPASAHAHAHGSGQGHRRFATLHRAHIPFETAPLPMDASTGAGGVRGGGRRRPSLTVLLAPPPAPPTAAAAVPPHTPQKGDSTVPPFTPAQSAVRAGAPLLPFASPSAHPALRQVGLRARGAMGAGAGEAAATRTTAAPSMVPPTPAPALALPTAPAPATPWSEPLPPLYVQVDGEAYCLHGPAWLTLGPCVGQARMVVGPAWGQQGLWPAQTRVWARVWAWLLCLLARLLSLLACTTTGGTWREWMGTGASGRSSGSRTTAAATAERRFSPLGPSAAAFT